MKGKVMGIFKNRVFPIFFMLLAFGASSDVKVPRFRVLVLAENDQYHTPMAIAGRAWIEKMGTDSNFSVDTIENLDSISTAFLARYGVLIKLNWWAFRWTKDKEAFFEDYMNSNGGWIGIHAACLCHAVPEVGEDDWTWYRDFIGGVNFVTHPAFQKATVIDEDKTNPVTKGLPPKYSLSEEWYEFDKDPRPNVHVLMRVDESTYTPVVRAPGGDHPEIWTNDNYHRALVCAMGHSPDEFTDPNFQTFLRNAIMWAAEPMPSGVRTPGIPGHATERSALVITKLGHVVSVHVAGSSPVSMKLTDAKGRRALTIYSGNGDLRFDRALLKSGIYAIWVRCGGSQFSAKLCLN